MRRPLSECASRAALCARLGCRGLSGAVGEGRAIGRDAVKQALLMFGVLLAQSAGIELMAQQPMPEQSVLRRAGASGFTESHWKGSWELGIAGGVLVMADSLNAYLARPAVGIADPNPARLMPAGVARLGYNVSRQVSFAVGSGFSIGNGLGAIVPFVELSLTPDVSWDLSPFVSLGGGTTIFVRDTSRLNAVFRGHIGAGFRIKVARRTALRLEGGVSYEEYEQLREPARNAFAIVGISVFAGGGPPRDGDGDGVPDRADRCANTPSGATVDGRGCPSDGDRDGVLNGLDRCPNTPPRAAVDAWGCIRDADRDGVADNRDRCANTPSGLRVDTIGCPIDTDRDGVPDHQDACANTAIGTVVDARGCPRDSDGDGVGDDSDRCGGTPRAVPVDRYGCTRDSDGDGVHDGADACPNTPVGRAVDAAGCEVDADGDGVDNRRDRCPGTLTGVPVDRSGCPPDADADGVPDHVDRCADTPQGRPVTALGCLAPERTVTPPLRPASEVVVSDAARDVPTVPVDRQVGLYVARIRVSTVGGFVTVFAPQGVGVSLMRVDGTSVAGSRARMADARSVFTFRLPEAGLYDVVARTASAIPPVLRARWVSALPR